ncbi:MAG: dihydroneopterin aldolase [Bacteroidia bacterium]|nr:dihydroneopterin aldolase [Bacteroidia bacterium]
MVEEQFAGYGLIAIEGAEFYGFHGHFPQERSLGGKFVVDVYLTAPVIPASQTDSLQDTVDYVQIYSLIQATMSKPRKLLETLANEIGSNILQRFSTIKSVRIRVSKVQPPLQGICSRTYVEVVL